jgi:hypothetical protein
MFQVFWDVTPVLGLMVPGVSNDRVAFIFQGQAVQETALIFEMKVLTNLRISVTADPTT